MASSVAPTITAQYDITIFLTKQDEIYTYPDVWVCLYDNYGCDNSESERQCVMSIFDTEGGPTRATYRPGDDHETAINFTATSTDETVWVHVSAYFIRSSGMKDCCIVLDDLK